jgi:hypothetical protein
MSLSCNIVEVLFAASFVVRVQSNGEGDTLASAARLTVGHDINEEAGMLLLSQSLVLSNDARYGSVREAMIACAERLVENKKTMPHKTASTLSWDMLALDVAKLSYHRRYVLRMLFEALDMCHSGVDCVKARVAEIKANCRGANNISTRDIEIARRELDESKRRYKLAAKKVDYFLSWSSTMWSNELGQELSEEVRLFVNDWQVEVQEEESSVEQLIRGIHFNANENAGGGSLADGLISISTVRKR